MYLQQLVHFSFYIQPYIFPTETVDAGKSLFPLKVLGIYNTHSEDSGFFFKYFLPKMEFLKGM